MKGMLSFVKLLRTYIVPGFHRNETQAFAIPLEVVYRKGTTFKKKKEEFTVEMRNNRSSLIGL